LTRKIQSPLELDEADVPDGIATKDLTSLKQTEAVVGPLLPVLVNKKGIVIDGRHRLKANPKWQRLELDLDEMKTHAVRLVLNTQRRIAGNGDYSEFAQYLRKTEPGDKKYTVKSGKTIAKRISELTGINLRSVQRHLEGTEFVGPQRPGKDDRMSSSRERKPHQRRKVKDKVKPKADANVPDEVRVAYREKVKALGLKKGYDTSVCPNCGKLLWTTGRVLEARL